MDVARANDGGISGFYAPPTLQEKFLQTNFGFRKFISSILCDVEKLAEFNGEIIFQIRP